MAWAVAQGRVVFTHELDFGTLLAATNAAGHSVLQVRSRDVLPEAIGALVVAAVRRLESSLAAGVLLTADVRRSRVRVLPLMGDGNENT